MPSRRTGKAPPTPEEYAEFIGQIELTSVWLGNATVQNHHGPESPAHAQAEVTSRASWEPATDGFRARHHYEVSLMFDSTRLADLAVTFGADYRSPQPMTDETFTIFSTLNLPVNTWPYLREFVANTLGRMQWVPLTLPALKVGVPDGDEQRPPRRRRRREEEPAPD